jgi:GAF domain-containing protein
MSPHTQRRTPSSKQEEGVSSAQSIMMNIATFSELQSVFQSGDHADVVLPAVLTLLGEQLQCDRCFVYLRNPSTNLGKVPFCWRRHDQIPRVYDAGWKPEPASLADEDPMFAAALQCAPSIYVEDVETASPDILNRQFEQENFGHRALIHAHLCQDGQLWGVLQPSFFGHPHVWSDRDRQLITIVEKELLPFAIDYVQRHG